MNRTSASLHVVVAASFLLTDSPLCRAGELSGARERATAEIAAQEYGITWQSTSILRDVGSAWHAPNRAHNLRTYFTNAGIRVVPREEAIASWEWGVTLLRHGRPGIETPAADAVLSAHENRMTYDRGEVVERYENGPRGLEHLLILSSRPVGAGNGNEAREMHLDLSWTGTLDPILGSDGRSIDFRRPGGAAVRYALLRVEDASGRALSARMERLADAEAREIRIPFDDDGAIYPVTARLLATSPDWTTESDQAFANYGRSVGTAGDVNGDGYSDVIVGAYFYDNGQSNEGRAYLYLGSATGLSTTASWTAEGNEVGAQFGFSVGTAGDVNGDGYSDVIVGAPLYDNGQTDEGSAFVFLGSASGLGTTAAWIGDGDDFGRMGCSVGTAGDVNGDGYSDVVIGATGVIFGQGKAFVYLGSAAGLASGWNWTFLEPQEKAQFGFSVGTAGDVNGDGYDDVIVSAHRFDNGQEDEGQARVYLGSATGLSKTAAWTGESDQAGADFGSSVGTAGDVNGDGYSDVIVGADFYDNGELDEGRAFVYLGSPSGLGVTPAWTVEGDQASDLFGVSVATAGDFNGDGYSDVVVGAASYDNDQIDEGRAFIYLGSASGLAPTAFFTAESDQDGAQLGISCGTAGDVDGDGSSDMIAGAYFYDNGQTSEGSASVYLGTGGPPPATLGGAVTGLATDKVTCQDQTTGESVADRTDETTWDCEALGLGVSQGDRVQTTAKGSVTGGGPVGGSVTRMTPSKVFCQNITTRKTVNVRTNATSWDCGAMGLVTTAGDLVLMGALGTAD